MKTTYIDINGKTIEARYAVLFHNIVEVEVITPYKGIRYEFSADFETADLYDTAHAEEFVKEVLQRLEKQIRIIQTYRYTYEALNDKYQQIAGLMCDDLQRGEVNNLSDKFWHHHALRKRLLHEFNNELSTLIPDNKERYKGVYLVHPALLSQILSAI